MVLRTAKTQYRKPRYNDKGEADRPEDNCLQGQVYVALGTAALVLAGRSINRVRLGTTRGWIR